MYCIVCSACGVCLHLMAAPPDDVGEGTCIPLCMLFSGVQGTKLWIITHTLLCVWGRQVALKYAQRILAKLRALQRAEALR